MFVNAASRAIVPITCAVVLLASAAAQAAPPPPRPGEVRTVKSITLDADDAQVIELPEPAKTVFVANPEIADIQLASPTNVLLYGKHAGVTTVFAIGETGVMTRYSVRVSRPSGELLATLRQEVPSAQISVTTTPGGITVSGRVTSPRDAARLRDVAQQFLGDKQALNFDVAVDAVTQVTLRVRVSEMRRDVTRKLGVNWNTMLNSGSLAVGLISGSMAALDGMGQKLVDTGVTPNFPGIRGNSKALTMIDALEGEGLASTLAEPNLTATSGETANFLAGGEFPIPVPQGSQNVTIDYTKYGVSVDFTPTVIDGNRISIKVRPEVSELDYSNPLKLAGVDIPALTVRRVETTVELGSGESFVIGGLFQNSSANSISQMPGIGDLPIIGALFRSTAFQRHESELVIIVTPVLVRPVARVADLHLPTEGLQFSSDIERILLGRVSSHRPTAGAQAQPRLRGQAGFMLE